MTHSSEINRRTLQVVVGAAVLIALGLIVAGVLIGHHFLPGVMGEWAGTMVGVMTTPFFLEASFICLGFFIVFLFNAYRRSKEGDELVYLDQAEDSKKGPLPEHAKWAVYQDKPLDGEEPCLADRVEGAVAVGDWDEATSLLSEMSDHELKQAQVLESRITLAEATGKHELMSRLRKELEMLGSHPQR